MSVSDDESSGVVDAQWSLRRRIEDRGRVRDVELKRAFLGVGARSCQVFGHRKRLPRGAAIVRDHRRQRQVRIHLRAENQCFILRLVKVLHDANDRTKIVK